MKTSIALAGCCIVVLLIAGCSTGRVRSDRKLTTEELAWVKERRIPVRLTVVPDKGLPLTNEWNIKVVSDLTKNLTRTELFNEVVETGDVSKAEILVVVRESHGVLRCGTSLPFTKMTLGLLRDNIAYCYSYDFDFVSTRTNEVVAFAKIYRGSYHTGFWSAKDQAFIELLKFDLAQKRDEIEALLK